MPEERNDIQIRSEEINEILTGTPSWVLRWGISVLGILIVVGLTLSYFIRYPDILTADITLTTLNPPVTLVARNNGKLVKLLVKDKALVDAGQTIGVIENTADYRDVLFLAGTADRLNEAIRLNDTLADIDLDDSLRVGELTPYYLQLLKTVKDIALYHAINPNVKRIALLRKDLEAYTALLAKYRKQQTINDEQLQLAEADYNRDKKLFEENVIAAREFESKKKEYLTALNSNEQIKITSSNALIQINSIEKNILQLKIEDYQEQGKLTAALSQDLKTLVAEIGKWKQLYLIQSPVKGRISFFGVWTVNQNLKQGDELFYIVPEQKQQFIGKCVLPMANTGKLAIGQQVNIKLDSYPYNEHGMLEGLVSGISEVPSNGSYAVDVSLPKGLTTTYRKTLFYKEQMKGKAEIITKRTSVMERIFFNFRKLLNRN